MEGGTKIEGFLHVNVLLCNLQGGHCYIDFTDRVKIVDLSEKSPYYTEKNNNSDSAKVSLVYPPGANVYLFVLL